MSQSAYGNKLLVVTLGGLLVAAVVTSCEDSVGKLKRPIAAPRPQHPAMGARTAVAADSERSLPAGHPSVGGGFPRARLAGSPRGTAGGSIERQAATSRSAVEMGADRRIKVGDVSFVVPEGWVNEPPSSSMRMAQFRLAGEGGDGILYVSIAAGGVTANIERWFGQFAEPQNFAPQTQDVGGVRVTPVFLEGTFTGMGRGQAQPDTLLLGAVAEVPNSPAQIFFKGTGPKATMEKWRASFEEMVSTIRLE